MDIKSVFTSKITFQVVFIILTVLSLSIVANLPIGLKYNHRLRSYVNFLGIPKITKIYDIKRHCDKYDDPYVRIVEGYGFENNKTTVWVSAEQSDYFYPLCINTAGDIIHEDFCNSKQADEYIIKFFEQP